jgi:hypothetical protein
LFSAFWGGVWGLDASMMGKGEGSASTQGFELHASA